MRIFLITIPKIREITQEEVDKQIKSLIAPLTKQLLDSPGLIQEMSTAHQPNCSPRAGTSANSSAAGTSPDSRLKSHDCFSSFKKL